jgi:hypothetical protein
MHPVVIQVDNHGLCRHILCYRLDVDLLFRQLLRCWYAFTFSCSCKHVLTHYTGWYGGWLDSYYRPSFSTYLSLVVVFTALGNIALAVMRWRLNEKGLLKALVENCSWIPLMAVRDF